MNRKPKKARRPSFRPEGLEPRGLLAGGISSGLNVVMELGEVSRAAALKGVEVAAPIAPDGSITFEFGAEAGGDYRLEVRHVGGGLTLQATGPSGGSASIDPGPAGPFSTIALPLKPGGYRIKASSVADQPVFVDWELLLTSGVGQSAAIGATLAGPSNPVPLPGLSGSAASSAAPPSPASPAISPASPGPSVSTSLIAAGGPVGRSDPARGITPVGPTSWGGAVALADAGDGLPVGALRVFVPVAEGPESSTSSGATPLLAVGAMGDAGRDLDALAVPAWMDQLARFQAWTTNSKSPPGPTVEGPAVVAYGVGDPIDEDSEVSTSQAASPGLIASGVVLASAARRWRPGRSLLAKCRKSSAKPVPFAPSRRGW